ncbi:MAG: FtsX-like permease family protein [Armatimonadota bacterium]
MKKQSFSIPFEQWAVAALFAVLTLAILYFFVTFAEPPERKPGSVFKEDYSEKPLADTLSPQGLQGFYNKVKAASMPAGARAIGRMPGSPGFYNTEQLIRKTFDQAGLKVETQEFQVIVPVTEYCDILDASGNKLPGVTLYPFEPNGLVPTKLPEKGLSGTLVSTDSSSPLDLLGKKLERKIGRQYVGNIVINNGLDASWPTLASMGVSAVIYRDTEAALRKGTDNPATWTGLLTPVDVAYPRFVAVGPIEKYADQPVTIRCKVTWQSKKVRNIVGVLGGDKPANEALVITSYYDSFSLVPELAPGAEQALSVAAMLNLVQAMAPYQGQLKRDVVFVATAGHSESLEGVLRLMQAIENFTKDFKNHHSLEAQLEEAQRKLQYAVDAQEILKSTEPWQTSENAGYRAKWMKQDPKFRKWFERAFSTVAGEINLGIREQLLQSRLEWIRAGKPAFKEGLDPRTARPEELADITNQHPLLRAYTEIKKMDTRAGNAISTPFWLLAANLSPTGDFDNWGYKEKARIYFDEIIAYHTQQKKELEDSRRIRKLFAPYNTTLTVNLELYSGGALKWKDLSVLAGRLRAGTLVEPQSTDLRNTIAEKAGSDFLVTSWGSRDVEGRPNDPNIHGNQKNFTALESSVWFKCGRLAFTIVTKNFFPAKIGTPDDSFDDVITENVALQLPAIGKALLAVANGKINFKALKYLPGNDPLRVCRGNVFASVGTSSLVPNHRMGKNVFVHFYPSPAGSPLELETAARGIRRFPIIQASPYGEFSRSFTLHDITPWGQPAVFDAVRFDDDGNLVYYKDASKTSQGIFKNELVPAKDLELGNDKPVNLELFRATQVACFQTGNPKTLDSFKGFTFLKSVGLDEPDRSHMGIAGTAAFFVPFYAYLEPDADFYIALKDGSAGNPDIQTTRAFMMNVDPDQKEIPTGEAELDGRGYLAIDTPNITFPYFDAAASMLRTNLKRLRLQEKYNMADAQMLELHKQGVLQLEEAREYRAAGDAVNAVNAAGRSLAAAINNHPVIRTKVSHAVFGIIWYLFLLVPFVFFFEKLVFGFTDIRKQLLAVGVTFIIVFMLLQHFHPAFQMVRSSIMILLGFLIFVLSLTVTAMVSEKFKQNLKELRRREGYVEGADINRGGVIGTAFMLGLNNMRRRKVRTGLTCVTLVLITFAMICFASTASNLVNTEYATGRSPSNGLLRRDPQFIPITANELNNLKQTYGLRYPVARTEWLVGKLDVQFKNTEILIDRDYTVGTQPVHKRAKNINAAMLMEWNEPQFSGIDRYLLTKAKGWFPRPPETQAEIVAATARGEKQKNYVILPDEVAKALGISVEDVLHGEVNVTIKALEYVVWGILDSAALTKHTGMDGQSILPYDLNSVQTLGRTASTGSFVVPQNIGRLRGSQVIVVNVMPPPEATESSFIVSCAVLFPKNTYQLRSDMPEYPGVTYREQRALISEYLGRVGIPAYYAIDGIAYYGFRTRARDLAGLLELLIPILIAAMTVFNTMRGSVYERREEIYVYNAVGIAPNHVFFMFMAEACVYAVIGAMLGYLLSQVTGTVLTMANLTGGLNMDYSSIETIYASIAIVASVMFSTLLPARTASRLALPSDEVSWTVPTAENDVMTFNLPFTFNPHDRVAVISYFNRWLDANGEGSSGPFFCSPPEPKLHEVESEQRSGGLVPCIEATIWLKPFDLGVSQRLEISLPTDPETDEYIAHVTIERLSGTTAAWSRTVMPFLTALRKQFLNWRAVTDTERHEMFNEAKDLFIKHETRETANV